MNFELADGQIIDRLSAITGLKAHPAILGIQHSRKDHGEPPVIQEHFETGAIDDEFVMDGLAA